MNELFSASEKKAIYKVKKILESKWEKEPLHLTSADAAKTLWQTRFAGAEREEFHAAFLNNQNQLIAVETMATGTINAASVYPREIAKRALQLNAASVIVAHNHPSGSSVPSRADIHLTKNLKSALELLDVKLLDHFIIGSTVRSMREHGYF